MSYIWTLDKTKSLEKAIRFFDGIVTNYPGRLYDMLRKRNIKLAKPNELIQPSSVYQMLGDKDDYVARDEGNEVKYYGRGFVNGKGGFFVNALEECEDACTETEGCHSFAYCGSKSCWLKDKVFNGDEATKQKGCATYYEL